MFCSNYLIDTYSLVLALLIFTGMLLHIYWQDQKIREVIAIYEKSEPKKIKNLRLHQKHVNNSKVKSQRSKD